MDLNHIQIIYQPLSNLIVGLYNLFGGNLTLAIVVIAVLFKLVTLPIALRQIKAGKKNKELQTKMEEVKERYKNDKEMQAKELAKYQGQLLGGTLGGCLPLILTLVMLLSMRSVIIDLMDRGWHAFNVESFTEDSKKKEDSLSYKLEQDLPVGKNEVIISLTSEKGKTKKYVDTFYVYETEAQKSANLTEWDKIYQEEQKDPNYLNNDIAVYSPAFVATSRDAHVINNKKPDLSFYFRAPTRETLDTSKTVFTLNGVDLTNKTIISKGEAMKFDTLGINLSKVATSFDIKDPLIIPYILIAAILGVTQIFSSMFSMNSMTAQSANDKPVEKSKDLAKKDTDSKDPSKSMENMMGGMNKQMTYFFAGITAITSLGFLGGAQFFPLGLSIFWTVQNVFGIIQTVIQNRLYQKKKTEVIDAVIVEGPKKKKNKK
ncbi:MAG: YidC/Oxa1 family membrane protein insertase [bacterium]